MEHAEHVRLFLQLTGAQGAARGALSRSPGGAGSEDRAAQLGCRSFELGSTASDHAVSAGGKLGQGARHEPAREAAARVDDGEPHAERDEVEHGLPAARLDGGLPGDVGGEQRGGERSAVRAARRRHDQPRSREITELDRSFARQGVRLRDDTEGMPVTHDALEASWERFTGAGPIWHGTAIEALRGIARDGIVPQARTHVHLTDGLDSRVGKRADVHLMIEISVPRLDALGIGVFQSQNGVVLARCVPPPALVGIRALSARAKRDEATLRALLGVTA